ncbi:MAG: hypothetical protein AAEC03_10300 [Synechococcus sp.]
MGDSESRELKLYIDNEYSLYKSMYEPQVKNLKRKLGKGVYDPVKAEKLFKYLADAGARKYQSDFGSSGSPIFSVQDRKDTAKELRISFEEVMQDEGYMTKDKKPTDQAIKEAMTKKELIALDKKLNKKSNFSKRKM